MMLREIALDTETTGLDPKSGHRIVEIGCVELLNHMRSGETFHAYINPDRDMPDEAYRVHGLSEKFLSDKPRFEEIAVDLRAFLGSAKLVIHNAGFDIGFLNAEFARIGQAPLPMEQAIDTVKLARRRFPSGQVNLDALCRRFDIDLSERTNHGALLDADLLAQVYLELRGGRQPGLELAGNRTGQSAGGSGGQLVERQHRAPRPHGASADEQAAHAAFLEKLDDPIWLR